jgi:hypothetical protein
MSYPAHFSGYPISYAVHMILLPIATGINNKSILFLLSLDTGFTQEIHDDFILLCPFLSLCPYSIDFMGIDGGRFLYYPPLGGSGGILPTRPSPFNMLHQPGVYRIKHPVQNFFTASAQKNLFFNFDSLRP